jgi:hypothetical protein
LLTLNVLSGLTHLNYLHNNDLRNHLAESFPETVTWLCDLLQVDRRTATFLVWDVCFRIGTDRHQWIDTAHAQRSIAGL